MNFYWAGWLLLGFGIPEAIAIITGHDENTLSETVWRWCDVMPGQTLTQWRFVHIALALTLLWLFFHLVFGIWR